VIRILLAVALIVAAGGNLLAREIRGAAPGAPPDGAAG